MFRHLSKINFAMYVLTMNSLKEVMEESTNMRSLLAWLTEYSMGQWL